MAHPTQMMKQPINMVEHELLALRIHTAVWEMVSSCQARTEEWHDLADAINVVEALCDMGRIKDQDVVRYRLQRAQHGMVLARKQPNGRMGMRGHEAECLYQVVSTYDHALGTLSRGTMKEAYELVKRKILLAKASANDGVIVVE